MLQIPPYGAGWYKDPVRRDGFRFLDDVNWTPAVSNADTDLETEGSALHAIMDSSASPFAGRATRHDADDHRRVPPADPVAVAGRQDLHDAGGLLSRRCLEREMPGRLGMTT